MNPLRNNFPAGMHRIPSWVLVLIAGIVLLGGIGGMICAGMSASSRSSASELLVQKVRSLTSVPNETPIVATIKEAGQRPDDPLYRDTEEGDLLLIFPVSQWAVIYRPSSNRIISSGTLVLNSGIKTYSSP